MAPRTRTSSTACRYQQFSALLSSAVLEWVLMLLMLLEGLLSYLATSFARLCKLQPPCPMCARLDHVFGEARYRDLMCSSHKLEASAWAFCNVHQTLADVHTMCGDCLHSFAADNKSNLETYRSLTGKLGGVGIGGAGCAHGLSLSGVSGGKVVEDGALCSCCSLPLRVIRSCPFVAPQRNDGGIGIGGVCRDVSRDRCVDEINHVGYSELKTSDSEPELMQRVGEFRRSSEHADIIDNLKEDFALIHGQMKIALGNAEEKVANYSELTLVQDRVSDQVLSEDSKEWPNVTAKIQANDLPSTDGEQISEETQTKDKLEEDVWYNTLGSTGESAGTTDHDKLSQAKSASEGLKAEVSDRTTTRQDSFIVHQDLNLLLSQVSTSSRTPDLSAALAADTPRLQEQQREHAILRNISRVLSLQRNYSGVSDGSMINTDAEAEEGAECSSTVDALRRQVELDRQSMALLWKELEEERSASAVAASQAMAMITRLQEEKAATRTEAAQYRRVMEEQSAYDREDAERLAVEVRDLEAEVERCRAELKDQEMAGEIRDQMRLPPRRREGPGGPSAGEEVSGVFVDGENAHISKQLRKLTDKLHRFSNSSQLFQEPEPTDDEQEDGDEEEEHEAEASEVGRRVRNADNFTKWQQLQYMEVTKVRGGDNDAVVGGEGADNMAGPEEEISELSGRLQADRSFLEHSVNSLRNGREGEAVILDIAHSLRELRKTIGNDVYDDR